MTIFKTLKNSYIAACPIQNSALDANLYHSQVLIQFPASTLHVYQVDGFIDIQHFRKQWHLWFCWFELETLSAFLNSLDILFGLKVSSCQRVVHKVTQFCWIVWELQSYAQQFDSSIVVLGTQCLDSFFFPEMTLILWKRELDIKILFDLLHKW